MKSVDTTSAYGYNRLLADLHKLQREYSFFQVSSIGTSVLGKPIYAIKMGSGAKSVHYNGAFHANEWITAMLLMKFIDDCGYHLRNGSSLRGHNVRKLFNNSSLWVVPMVNPDGVELSISGLQSGQPYYETIFNWNDGSLDFSGWKANIRGVDLNDQFPAHWEDEKFRRMVVQPGPRDYGGVAPLTEPEAIAMAYFTCIQQFEHVIAFHSQGEEIYWNYRGYEPPESQEMVKRFQKASGYLPVKITDSDAGYKDWFIQEFRKPGFTVEVGLGTNPLPVEQFSEIYERVIYIMLLGLQ